MARELVVAVDAMGGDNAPGIVVKGVEIALVRHPEARFLLCGDQERLNPLIDASPRVASASAIRHTPDLIAMSDKPSKALRRGGSSSMALALDAVKAGEAVVAISAGNTGALMALARQRLGSMPGIDRPAIAAIWPTMRGESIVLDVGANIEVTAKMLVDFAVMGEAFARAVLGLTKPSVALLNIGTEELKGNEGVRTADRILRAAEIGMDYRGYVEGDAISAGEADVIVTDGFSGNVALKTAEGTARLVSSYLSSAMQRSLFSRLGAVLAMGAFRTLKARLDPRRVNGGTFLGLNGVVVKSHGGTDETGFAYALDLAIDMAQSRFAAEIAERVAGIKSAVDAVEQGGAGEAASSGGDAGGGPGIEAIGLG
ncbi:MAG: phosphate acyltransferase PlsX [Alphaproteobacteria bacterium]|nr:phosphate acyltransferase PlsX [Alphaproteobacteria bacterium]